MLLIKIPGTTLAFFFFSMSAISQAADNNMAASQALFLPVEKTILYKLGNRHIPVKIIQYGNRKNITCINLHDNEMTAVQAAKTVLEETGGTLIKIENNQQRNIRFRLKGIVYSFDPNRMFSRVGIEETLRKNGRISRDAMTAVERFAQRMLRLIPNTSSCVIALHNNTDENYSVRSYLPGNDLELDARKVYRDSGQDEDDIAFTTDSLLYQGMADSGYNSIWQDNKKAKRDGSLSIWFGERNRKYINIETEHGKIGQYIEMLQKLMAILNE